MSKYHKSTPNIHLDYGVLFVVQLCTNVAALVAQLVELQSRMLKVVSSNTT